jgi:hypothetical protein
MVLSETAPAPRVISGEPETPRSSCEIKTSVRGCDIAVKAYVGSPIGEACDAAVRAYFSVFDRVEAELLGRRVRA